MNTTPSWDVICIGSGITSLAFASEVLRLHPHLNVLVLDKHSVPGGYSSEFVRPKMNARFDCSLHKLSGMGEHGNLRQALHTMGVADALELHYEPVMYEASMAGGSFVMPSGAEQALLDLIEAFPAEEAGLRAYFNDVAVHGYNQYMQFQMMSGEIPADMVQLRFAQKTLKPITVLEGLRRLMSDPRLIEILSMPVAYIGGYPEEVSYLYFLHIVYTCQFTRCAYVKGGSQHLSNTLVEKIRAAGGTVLLNSRVEQIVLDAEQKVAVGVRTKDQLYHGSHIVINSAPQHAVNELMAGYSALDEVRAKLDNLIPANATTTACLVTDVPPAELGLTSAETMIFSHDLDQLAALRQAARAAPENEALAEEAYWARSTLELTNYQMLDSTGGNVILISALDDIRHWPQRKTPEYRAKKKRALDALLARMLAHKPGLAGHIVYSEISTPRTYLRYTNNTGGSGYGARVTTHQSGHNFQYRFPVSNISFMSAWVAGSGYEAGVCYAAMKAKGFRHLHAGLKQAA